MSNGRCRFGYTEISCAEKDNPPCGGNCELQGKSLNSSKYKSYREVYGNK